MLDRPTTSDQSTSSSANSGRQRENLREFSAIGVFLTICLIVVLAGSDVSACVAIVIVVLFGVGTVMFQKYLQRL
jgi:heme/copper-type cytochrome/quinol oxidase subunit 4